MFRLVLVSVQLLCTGIRGVHVSGLFLMYMNMNTDMNMNTNTNMDMDIEIINYMGIAMDTGMDVVYGIQRKGIYYSKGM